MDHFIRVYRKIVITILAVLLLAFLFSRYLLITCDHLNEQHTVRDNKVLFLLLYDTRTSFNLSQQKNGIFPIVVLFDDGMMLWRKCEDGSLYATTMPLSSLSSQNGEVEYQVFFLSNDRLCTLLATMTNDIGITTNTALDVGYYGVDTSHVQAVFYFGETELILRMPSNFLGEEPTYRKNDFVVKGNNTVDQRDMSKGEYVKRCRKMVSRLADEPKYETGLSEKLKVVSSKKDKAILVQRVSVGVGCPCPETLLRQDKPVRNEEEM